MIQHRNSSQHNTADSAFAEQVRRESGVAIDRCYQCLTCTLGCDAAFAMDYMPSQVVRLAQLGFRDALLNCRSIWVCTACESCVTRCPNDIDIPHLIDTLHQMALREGARVPEPAVPVFHRAFLEPVRRFGRQFEALMTGLFLLRSRKLSARDLMANATLGFQMIRRGKLKFTPPSVRGAKTVQDIFRKTIESGKS